MRDQIGTTGPAPAIASTRQIANDLDYLAARLHARRSNIAPRQSDSTVCPHTRNLRNFVLQSFRSSSLQGVFLDFQRLLVHELIVELSGLSAHMFGSGSRLYHNWTLAQVPS